MIHTRRRAHLRPRRCSPRRHVRRATRRSPIVLVALALTTAGCTGSTVGGQPGGPAAGHPSTGSVQGQPAPDGAHQLLAVSCADALHCWAVGTGAGSETGAAIEATTDGGHTWHAQAGRAPRSSEVTTLNAVSCADWRHCMALGDVTFPALAPTVLTTSDAGRQWVGRTSPGGAVDLTGVYCSGPATCTALATDGASFFTASTTDDGATWQRAGTLPAGFGGASGLDCDSSGRCVVAGYTPSTSGHGSGAVAVSTTGGATWALAAVPPGIGVLHAVSCAGTSCLAVGTTSGVTSGVAPGHGLVLSSVDGGTTFAARPTPVDLDDGFGVSCPAAGRCVAVGTRWTPTIPATPLPAVAATTDLGVRFSDPSAQFVPAPLVSVACAAATMCVAAGGSVLATAALPAPSDRR